MAATAARPDAVEITGTPQWFSSSARAQRAFCGTCGANLFWRAADHLSIFAGTLDSHPADLRLAAHIYCRSQGDYYSVDDGLPRAEGWKPDILTGVVR